MTQTNGSAQDPLALSGLVIVDKPAGMTSHDVVARMRRCFATRKVGHAGTLDPMATGVLLVGVERGTKFLNHLVAATKSYTATIRFGLSTTTDDKEGTPISGQNASHLQERDIESALAQFRGKIMQKPAAVSAIKIAGKRAHERVRAGEAVDIPARPVEISRFDILAVRHVDSYCDVDVVVDCSSGTYIRSLARDLGEVLQVGGHLTALRRTHVGSFSLQDARPLADIEAQAQAATDALLAAQGIEVNELPAKKQPRGRAQLSLSLDEAILRCYPRFDITDAQAQALAQGKWLEPCGLDGIHAATTAQNQVIALVKESSKRLATVFVARPSTL